MVSNCMRSMSSLSRGHSALTLRAVMTPDLTTFAHVPYHTDLPSSRIGKDPSKPTYVAIKGVVFDVSKNKAYQPGGAYAVFAGKDPSRALASSSLKAEECVPDWYDLPDEKKTVLNDWYKFFSKRYNIVGKVSRCHL